MLWKKPQNEQKDIFSFVKVNDRVQLAFGAKSYLSRVEDVHGEELFAAVPMTKEGVVPVRPGTDVGINVFLDLGIWRFGGAVKTVAEDRVPYLVLSDFQDLGKLQRREYVRVSDKLHVRYRRDTGNKDGEPWSQATANNVSGGGVHIACDRSACIQEKDFAEVEMCLPGCEPLYAIGRVVRVWSVPGSSTNMGIEFVQIHPAERRKIVQYVQKKQAVVAASQKGIE